MTDRRPTCINSDHNHASIEETWACREDSDKRIANAAPQMLYALREVLRRGDLSSELKELVGGAVAIATGSSKVDLTMGGERVRGTDAVAADAARIAPVKIRPTHQQ